MKVSSSLFETGLQCTTKCFLKWMGETGSGNDYADWIRAREEAYRIAAIRQIVAGYRKAEVIEGPLSIEKAETAGWKLAINFIASHANLESSIHLLEHVASERHGVGLLFIPVRFTSRNILTRSDKLILVFDSLVLSGQIGHHIGFGKLLHGDKHATLRVKTPALASEVRRVVAKIETMLSANQEP